MITQEDFTKIMNNSTESLTYVSSRSGIPLGNYKDKDEELQQEKKGSKFIAHPHEPGFFDEQKRFRNKHLRR